MLSVLFTLHFYLYLAFPHSSQAQELAKTFHKKIYFVNVGQGDFTLLVLKNSCWFFDPGGQSPQISKGLQALLLDNCSQKNMEVVVSHFDKDHYSKIKSLIRLGHPNRLYYSNPQPHSFYGKKLLRDLQKTFSRAIHLSKPQNLYEEALTITLTPPSIAEKKKIENDWSLTAMVFTGQKRILITGDATVATQRLTQTTIDILRVSHHGSSHNTTFGLIKMLAPKICVVSVGSQNSYGHPHPQALDSFRRNHCAILRTDRLGTIEIRI